MAVRPAVFARRRWYPQGAAARFAAERGAASGELIAHTTSHGIEPAGSEPGGTPSMWVGYAGIVF